MQKRSANTRARLLDCALKEFSVRGFEATSVDDICTRADVSKGAFYHHFDSKQSLFLTLLESWLQTIDEGLAGLQQSTVPGTLVRMTEILPDILAATGNQLPMFLEFWLKASRDEKVRRATIEPYRHFRNYFGGLVSQGISEGSFRQVNSQVAGQVILSLALGILLQALIEPEGADWARTARQGMEVLMKGLES